LAFVNRDRRRKESIATTSLGDYIMARSPLVGSLTIAYAESDDRLRRMLSQHLLDASQL